VRTVNFYPLVPGTANLPQVALAAM